jgi:steroid delta-isomerase-like uncharacterized protein
MAEEHASFVEQLIDAWNSHDPAHVATFYAPDYHGEDIGQEAPFQGPADVEAYFARFYCAFPDVQITLDSVVTQADHYAVAWTVSGTHLGKLMNIPPTGRPVAVRGISLLTVVEDKVTAGATVWDMAGLLRAIGLLPKLAR